MFGKRWGADSGNGTVVTTALVMIALLLSAAIMLWITATNASMRAASAADLAALAAADTARGLRAGEPCAVAQSLASANRARLESCTLEGAGTVRIEVSVPIHFQALGISLYSATAKARAGAPPLDQR